MTKIALESTIITHGLPWPENFQLAQELETMIKDAGHEPVTMAVIDGELKFGLSRSELESLAKTGTKAKKISSRELPTAKTLGWTGGTTVAATMVMAKMSGVKLFATGGIGGVHRGWENSLDISADLEELGKTNVTVISAGMKSLLDLSATMEYLETKQVPVIGFKTIPYRLFICDKSPLSLEVSLDDPSEIAKLISEREKMNFSSGMIIANPIPSEHSLNFDEMESVIQKALGKASSAGVTGKETTPFLLRAIKK